MYLAHRGPVRKPPKIGGSSKGQRNIAAILYLGAKLVIEGSLTVGELAAFNMLAARVRFLAMTSRQTPIYSFTSHNDIGAGATWLLFSIAAIWLSLPGPSPTPPDMKDVFAAMAQAKQAIIFLVFQPGSPSIVEYAAACENAKPGLLIYGAATDPNASEDYKTLLIHRSTKDTEIVRDDTDVVSASGISTQFAYWQKELLKLPNAHANYS